MHLSRPPALPNERKSVHIRFNGIHAGALGELRVADLPAPEDEIDTSRTNILGGDGQAAGADYHRGSMWDITLLVNTYSYKDGRRVVNAVRDAWLDPEVRLSTEAFPLEYSKNGLDWFKVYGRPVNFGGPPEGTRLDQGVAYIELQFEQTDTLHYSVGTESVTVNAARGASGGIRIHEYGLRAPLTAGRTGGVRNERAENTGNREAFTTIRFNGPGRQPSLRLGDLWTLQISGSLEWDEYLVIDSRSRDVRLHRTTGHSVRPAFNRVVGSRLSTLTIPPGSHALTFQIIDDSQMASVDVEWSHTFYSMQHSLGEGE